MSLITRKRLVESLDDGCVLYLPFWENAGTKAEDLSGLNNHGTFIGFTAWVAGVMEYGARVRVVNPGDAITFIRSASLDALQASTNFTFSLWLYASSTAVGEDIMGFTGYNPYWGYTFTYLASGALNIRFQDAAGNWIYVNSTNLVTFDAWNFVAITFDGVNFCFYVNTTSELVPSATGAGSQTSTFQIGLVGWTSTVPRDVDEVRVWNRALTNAEVFEEYYRGARRSY